LWHSRNRLGRPLGLALLALSGVFLLAAASLPNQIVFEVISATAFVFGVVLLAAEVEPRVKLLPASESLYGPTIAFSQLASGNMKKFKAVFQPRSRDAQEGGMMSLVNEDDPDGSTLDVPSVGDGLFRAYERELGSLEGRDSEYLEIWLPRLITQALGLAENMKIKASSGAIKSSMVRPFVRVLCVQESMQNNVCCATGCALAASIGQSFAAGLNRKVAHVSCTYDPITQTATATHRVLEPEDSP